MTSTDPIADMLSRLRNAAMADQTLVNIPFSNLKHRLAEELQRAGFVAEVKTDGEGVTRQLIVRLRDEHEPHRFSVIERVSKPGRRLYAKAEAIPRVMNGRGVMILSTSRGLMTDRAARKASLGGELICKVY